MEKLMIIAPDFYPTNSGYSNAITSFVNSVLRFTDIKVDILTFTPLNGKPELEGKNIKIHRIKWIKVVKGINFIINETRLARNIDRLDKINNYDFIMFETASYPLAGLITFMKKGLIKKSFVRVHASAETEWVSYFRGFENNIKKYLIKKFFCRIPTITSTNKYHLDFVIKHFLSSNPFIYGKKRLFVIPNTSLENKFVKNKEIENKFGFLKDKYTFLTLGRMSYPGYIEKNFSRIMEAVHYLKGKSYYEKLLFLIIGKGQFKEELIKFSEKLKIKNRLMFIDHLDNKEIQFLQGNVNCIILASIHEGMSSFATESLKNRGCLLFSNTGGIGPMIEDGINGYHIDPKDSMDIANKIDLFLNNMLPKMDFVRKESARIYEEKFEAKKIISVFVKFLEILNAYKGVRI